MSGRNRFVLDSYALIGYLEGEPFSSRIAHLLVRARKKEVHLFTHALQVGEVYYITLREQGKKTADLAYARIKRFPLTIVNDIGEQLLLAAAGLKAYYAISYADAVAAALADIKACRLLSGDPEFRKLEQDGLVSMEWL